jgi:hypothetical protein
MTNMTVTDLLAEIKRQQALKQDFIATSWDGFKLDGGGSHLELEGLSSFSMRDYAHADMAGLTLIPKPYYDRMRREQPELLASNVNHWLEAKREPRLIRTLGGQARALLSSKFRPLDNDQLIEAALPALADHSDLRIKSCELTERKLYLKAVLPKLEFEVKRGDVVQFGLSISNSEIGQGALEIAIFALRLVCLNGMVVPDGKQRKNHLGGRLGNGELAAEYLADDTRQAADHAFFLKLRDTTKHMLSEVACESALEQMRRSVGEVIGARPDKVVRQLARRVSLTEDEGDGVLAFLLQGGELTQWGLANAVTAHAGVIEDADRQDELQRLGGKLISLSAHEWSQVSEAA